MTGRKVQFLSTHGCLACVLAPPCHTTGQAFPNPGFVWLPWNSYQACKPFTKHVTSGFRFAAAHHTHHLHLHQTAPKYETQLEKMFSHQIICTRPKQIRFVELTGKKCDTWSIVIISQITAALKGVCTTLNFTEHYALLNMRSLSQTGIVCLLELFCVGALRAYCVTAPAVSITCPPVCHPRALLWPHQKNQFSPLCGLILCGLKSHR